MELDKFIDAIGKPEEWSKVYTETVLIDDTPETILYTDERKIIGSVATKQEVNHALDSLRQS